MKDDDFAVDYNPKKEMADTKATADLDIDIMVEGRLMQILGDNLTEDNRDFIDRAITRKKIHERVLDDAQKKAFQQEFDNRLHMGMVNKLAQNFGTEKWSKAIKKMRDEFAKVDPRDTVTNQDLDANHIYAALRHIADHPDQFPKVCQPAQRIAKSIHDETEWKLVSKKYNYVERKLAKLLEAIEDHLQSGTIAQFMNDPEQNSEWRVLPESLNTLKDVKDYANRNQLEIDVNQCVQKISDMLSQTMEAVKGNGKLTALVKGLQNRTNALMEENLGHSSYTDRIKPISSDPRWR